jgi:hypothetical protein
MASFPGTIRVGEAIMPNAGIYELLRMNDEGLEDHMLECVARAICLAELIEAANQFAPSILDENTDVVLDLVDDCWRESIPLARAAIKAAREIERDE